MEKSKFELLEMLYKSIDENGTIDEKTIELSQKLDKVIVIEQLKINNKNLRQRKEVNIYEKKF
ncbi:Spo0E family sporulation regulatory protein-aspartic acid phosphatase (plasmid) [Clostridium beijerinckii]|uniref:Spo0E family sporulation regulatory protein-aspartic acid phosphatase n=1 Tax=Clostridium beijerinckii TaxID=1520 RepID=UPI002226ED42|nr:Spo0E family sporulation regulatory protein-aspartic acid phosphatase [Clostridium beijerinckii]UYZ39081.1 Spo0E family sporulation regulatory protein-aspartic acid phosphatase [Clostridium beijerinckii]